MSGEPEALGSKAMLIDLATAVLEYGETRDAYLEVAGCETEDVLEAMSEQVQARRDEMFELARKSLAAAPRL